MDLRFNSDIAASYKSKSQLARVLTENWVSENLYCPLCGYPRLRHYPANRPVRDFCCDGCKAEFELKSKKGAFGKKVAAGEYNTMIRRITSLQSPHFLFMAYVDYRVDTLFFIPNYLFVPDLIEKRAPLQSTARRHGWTGCMIDLEKIPSDGKIHIVEGGAIREKKEVTAQCGRLETLNICDLELRGWTLSVLHCIDRVGSDIFTLGQVYSYENELLRAYPSNNCVKAKIRQQLQYLRDKGFVEFISPGRYRRVR